MYMKGLVEYPTGAQSGFILLPWEASRIHTLLEKLEASLGSLLSSQAGPLAHLSL